MFWAYAGAKVRIKGEVVEVTTVDGIVQFRIRVKVTIADVYEFPPAPKRYLPSRAFREARTLDPDNRNKFSHQLDYEEDFIVKYDPKRGLWFWFRP